MKKVLKISFNNYQNLLNVSINKAKNILWILGRNAFLFILIFILLGMFFGEYLFYKYVFLVKIENPEIVSSQIKFQKDTYESVLKEWQKREDFFKKSSQENYPNPFR